VEVAFSHWSASWPVLMGYVVVVAAYLAGLPRLLALSDAAQSAQSGPGNRQELWREAALFHVGLLIVALVLVSPVGYWSGVFLWVRALQVLVLAVFGPGLIVLGAPWAAFGLTGARRNWLMSRPALGVVAANVVWLGWQLPVLVDLAHGNAAVALAEHVSYVAAGLVFWLRLISSRPFSQPNPPLRRLTLLIGSVIASTVLGMVLVFGMGVLYPAYASSAHHIMTLLDDQQLSGAVLWMGMLPVQIIAGIALLFQWLSNEESAELSAGLDRLLDPRRHGWPSRPVIR
jgi:putative membrane protein